MLWPFWHVEFVRLFLSHYSDLQPLSTCRHWRLTLSIISHGRPRDLGSRFPLTYANDGGRATRDLHEQVWWDNNMLHRTAAITESVIALSWSALPTRLFGFIYLFVSPPSAAAACIRGGVDVELHNATDRTGFTVNASRFVFWLEGRLV